MSNGEDDGERRGYCTDNAVAAIGVVLERIDAADVTAYASLLPSMWSQWLAYLPLRHDVEEGHKVIRQLMRCIHSAYRHFHASTEYQLRATDILRQVQDSVLVTDELNLAVKQCLSSLSS